MGRRAKHLLKEALGSPLITLDSQKKINALSGGVHGPLEIPFLSLDLNLGLLHPVALVDWFQIGGRQRLCNSGPYTGTQRHTAPVHSQSALGQQLGEVFIGQRG